MTDDTRSRILHAAGEIFAQKGFAGATIREICKQADVNVAAINYHFGDKSSLYFQAVKQAYCEQEDADAVEWPEGASPEEKLFAFIRVMMTDMLDREIPSWHLELMMREMARPTEACHELVRNFIGPRFDLLLSIIDELIPANTPLRKRHLLAFSVVGQCLLYRFHRPVGRLLVGEEEFESLFNVDDLSTHICQFCLHGFSSIKQEQEANS